MLIHSVLSGSDVQGSPSPLFFFFLTNMVRASVMFPVLFKGLVDPPCPQGT